MLTKFFPNKCLKIYQKIPHKLLKQWFKKLKIVLQNFVKTRKLGIILLLLIELFYLNYYNIKIKKLVPTL